MLIPEIMESSFGISINNLKDRKRRKQKDIIRIQSS